MKYEIKKWGILKLLLSVPLRLEREINSYPDSAVPKKQVFKYFHDLMFLIEWQISRSVKLNISHGKMHIEVYLCLTT
ncbi:MAG: hypothetical protein ACR2LR_16525 [Hassallia sp.]